MSNHAWCRDVARDAAVRAAEDGRDRPLPTLEECIETAFSAGVRDSFRKVEEAWAMIPKSVSASSAPEQENKGDGMRTERVTLEITHDESFSVSHWSWVTILRIKSGESVRVVEDAAQAASGGGEGKPVAWRVEYRGFIELYSVEQFATERASEVRGTVVPLYRAPPQPRGWLTGEERDAVQWAAEAAYDKQHPAEDTLRNLLARSTPPEVVLESWREAAGEVVSLDDVRAALAAIGVEVKEVGK